MIDEMFNTMVGAGGVALRVLSMLGLKYGCMPQQRNYPPFLVWQFGSDV